MNTYGERLDLALSQRRPEDKNARQWLADQLDISVQAIGRFHRLMRAQEPLAWMLRSYAASWHG